MYHSASTAPDLEDLRNLIARTFELSSEEITDDARFVQDLGMDSLITLEIATRLQDRYGVDVSDDELKSIGTLMDVRGLLMRKLADA